MRKEEEGWASFLGRQCECGVKSSIGEYRELQILNPELPQVLYKAAGKPLPSLDLTWSTNNTMDSRTRFPFTQIRVCIMCQAVYQAQEHSSEHAQPLLLGNTPCKTSSLQLWRCRRESHNFQQARKPG